MAAKTLTPELVRRIQHLHDDHGLGATRISREIGRSYYAVRDVLTGKTWVHVTGGRLSHGRRERPGESLSPKLVKQIQHLYTEQKLGVTKISREIDRSYQAVNDVLVGKTWTHITGGRLSQGRRDRIGDAVRRKAVQMARDGKSYREVARRVGVADMTIRRWVLQCG